MRDILKKIRTSHQITIFNFINYSPMYFSKKFAWIFMNQFENFTDFVSSYTSKNRGGTSNPFHNFVVKKKYNKNT